MPGLSTYHVTDRFFGAIWDALGGDASVLDRVEVEGSGTLRSRFAVGDFATASFGAAAAAIAELVATETGAVPPVTIDRARASAWVSGGYGVRFSSALAPIGWKSPQMLTGLGGFFATRDDRFVHFQLNFPVRSIEPETLKLFGIAADRAYGTEADRDRVAAFCAENDADDIQEVLIDEAGYLVTATRTLEEWAAHPQGRAVAASPLVDVEATGAASDDGWRPTPERPLAGIRVLDVTRILSGPVSTRFLAGYGAEVLRIDPPGYEDLGDAETAAGDIRLGKRCAFLDVKTSSGHERFLELLASADVFVHGIRPGALEGLGFTPEVIRAARPGLVEVALDAYGTTGPWAGRRGHDSTTQTAAGWTMASAAWSGAETPVLTHRILDLGTSQVIAAAVIRGLTRRVVTGEGSYSHCVLARTAGLIASAGEPGDEAEIELPFPGPFAPGVTATPGGPARRLLPPQAVEGAPQFWERTSELLGSSAPVWASLTSAGRRATS